MSNKSQVQELVSKNTPTPLENRLWNIAAKFPSMATVTLALLIGIMITAITYTFNVGDPLSASMAMMGNLMAWWMYIDLRGMESRH